MEKRKRRRSSQRYWLVGPTVADLGPEGSDDGYTLAKARKEAGPWIFEEVD